MPTADEKTLTADPSPVEDKFYPTETKPDVNADPSTARSETPDKTGAVQTEAAPEPAENEAEPLSTDKSPRLSWRELRISKEKSDERAARAEARAELLEQQANQRKAESLPAPAKEPPTGKPKSDDFATYDEFLDARDAWNKAEWEKEQTAKQKQTDADKAAAEAKAQSAKHADRWNTREASVKGQFPAYDASFSVFLKVAQQHPALAHAVFESELGPDLAQYLGANVEELTRIQSLDPLKQRIAVGILEDKLQGQLKEKGSTLPITKAPRPLADVSGTASAPVKELAIEDRFYK